jgi:uncharacterized protein (TIGR03118 family)
MRRVVLGRLAAVAAILSACAVAAVPAGAAPANSYTVHPLVSTATDASLVNAWGLTAGPATAASPGTPWWVADNGTGVSTLYDGTGAKQPLTVNTGSAAPTGVVFNLAGSGFVVRNGAKSGPARFLFDGEDGVITGWNPAVSPGALPGVPSTGAIYKGLAYAITPVGAMLYASNFASGHVDVFDSSWMPVATPGGFADPSLPADYAPFGIQTIGNRVFVTFVPREPGATDEEAGQGHGIVDAFSLDGWLLARVAQHGQLNAPWGLALAPASFGRFAGDLLVGNFGDGTINAYEELPNGQFEHRGQLRTADGQPLTIDGLWALQFGLGPRSGGADTLFFTAGPEDESLGLFGSITP